MPVPSELVSTAQPSPPPLSVAESGKGPRRRNRAERAALQQEQDLLEQQKAKRSFRCPPIYLLADSLQLPVIFKPKSSTISPLQAAKAAVMKLHVAGSV